MHCRVELLIIIVKGRPRRLDAFQSIVDLSIVTLLARIVLLNPRSHILCRTYQKKYQISLFFPLEERKILWSKNEA